MLWEDYVKPTALSLLIVTVPSFAQAYETRVFQLCNHMDYAVHAAISEREAGMGGRVVKGWYAAEPGACANIEIHEEYFYIHVRGRRGNQIRVTIPQPSPDPVYDTQIEYCFDSSSRFEYHGTNTSYCPNGERETFHDWYPDQRGLRWDLR